MTSPRPILTAERMRAAEQATIDVHDTKVHVTMLLPGMLGMFAGVIQSALQKKGGVLLEDHSKG